MKLGRLIGFRTWKTLNLGTKLKTPHDFREALQAGNFKIGFTGTNEILNSTKFFTFPVPVKVDLVNVSVEEFGFKSATIWDLLHRARNQGLRKCPIEVGPQLRLQLFDQPLGETLNIGMDPFELKGEQVTSTYNEVILDVNRGTPERNPGFWLAACGVHKNSFSAKDRFIFMKTKLTLV